MCSVIIKDSRVQEAPNFCFHQMGHQAPLVPTNILLDSTFNIDVFCNPALLHNIHQVNNTVTVHSNGGKFQTNRMGLLQGYGMVWFHQHATVNVLSLENVTKKWHVTFDSKHGNCFTIHQPNKLLNFSKLA